MNNLATFTNGTISVHSVCVYPINEIGFTSRFFQAKLAYQLVYHNNSGTLPLRTMSEREVMKNHE